MFRSTIRSLILRLPRARRLRLALDLFLLLVFKSNVSSFNTLTTRKAVGKCGIEQSSARGSGPKQSKIVGKSIKEGSVKDLNNAVGAGGSPHTSFSGRAPPTFTPIRTSASKSSPYSTSTTFIPDSYWETNSKAAYQD
ncbi:hypothetical protein K504DRAFT_297074 [Pleomassaria siparia CBS 279.74]|uniref:Uncharacterized protein n=1 Tax=Pleomassaria siparia CBS 279.74 TaxID=1314801 RepID=A0A6G1K549_9PLEO|nr:hypothetical protein K504DRAFT_297074 [Pleomassaria siparia CBS 279.74]